VAEERRLQPVEPLHEQRLEMLRLGCRDDLVVVHPPHPLEVRGVVGRAPRVGQHRLARPQAVVRPDHAQVHERPELLRHRQLERLPHLRLRARPGITRVERRVGKDVVEILGDDVRLVEHPLSVHERRDDAVRVQGQVLRALLLHPRQVDEARRPGEALFEQHRAHPPGAG